MFSSLICTTLRDIVKMFREERKIKIKHYCILHYFIILSYKFKHFNSHTCSFSSFDIAMIKRNSTFRTIHSKLYLGQNTNTLFNWTGRSLKFRIKQNNEGRNPISTYLTHLVTFCYEHVNNVICSHCRKQSKFSINNAEILFHFSFYYWIVYDNYVNTSFLDEIFVLFG